MRHTRKRRRLARKIAGRARVVDQTYIEGADLDPDFFPQNIGIFRTKARVANMRTFVSIVPVSEDAYKDGGVRKHIVEMANAQLPRQIEDALVRNPHITGPRRGAYLPT